MPTSNNGGSQKRKVYNMPQFKEIVDSEAQAVRPDQAVAPAEHKGREGASGHSGWQPSSKHSSQGSTAEETSISKNQRGGRNTDR
jgi:hypothetical protein